MPIGENPVEVLAKDIGFEMDKKLIWLCYHYGEILITRGWETISGKRKSLKPKGRLLVAATKNFKKIAI